MEHFTEELIEKTLLWAKKRLTDPNDAEELTSQILCEALAAYRSAEKHQRPIEAFYPWYWRLASNQLNIFLRLKYSSAVSLDGLCDILISPDDTEDELIRADEIRALNYSVARLSKLHREIIIEYYLREKPVGQIAAELGVPTGTVRRRLFDAKEDVKRSIDTMETAGRSAYAPAELILWGCLSAPNYWNNLSDLIVKQILVACRKTPRTVREISDEIAVAPVYFEEKLEWLKKCRFLKETSNGKYLTDIVILPGFVWAEFSDELTDVYDGIGAKLKGAILGCEDRLRSFDYYGNDLPTGKLMWFWYVTACMKLADVMIELFGKDKRLPDGSPLPKDNGKDYRYMGIVNFPDDKPYVRKKRTAAKSSVSWSNLHMHFRTPDYRQITYANLFEAQPFADRDKTLNQENIALFMRLSKEPGCRLTEVEQSMAAELIAAGFLEKRGDGLFPTLPIMSYRVYGDIEQLLREAVEPIALEYAAKVGGLGDRILLPNIRSDLYEEYANWVMRNAFFPLNRIFGWAMYDSPAEGELEIPDDYLRSSSATAIYYK